VILDLSDHNLMQKSEPSFPLKRRRKKQDVVYEALLSDIQNEMVPVGSFLPSTRQLARLFRTSLTPVNLALRRLEGQAYVETIHGSGVVVRATSTREADIRMKPLVEVVTPLTGVSQADGSPATPHLLHSLPAVPQWMLWALNEHSGLRVRTCVLTHERDEQQFLEILRESLIFQPRILAVPLFDAISDEALDLMRQLRQKETFPILRVVARDIQDFDRVCSDFRRGQRELTDYLVEKGRREILRIAADQSLLYEQEKQKGFEDGLKAIGVSPSQARSWTLEIPPELRFEKKGQDLLNDWSEFFSRVLRQRPNLDAVMTFTDVTASTAQLALARLGHPEIEVTGYDNNWREQRSRIVDMHGESALAVLKQPPSVDTCLNEFGIAMADLAAARAFNQLPKDQIQVRIIRQRLALPNEE
jgi:DNA-binding transcriptional regulator YhcF (GntR family)